MKLPENITVYEHDIASYYFDEDGICRITAKNTPRNMDMVKDHIVFLKNTFKDQKLCVLANATDASPLDKECRDYMASEIKHIYKALAIVSNSLVGRTISNNFMISQILDPDAVPMKIFTCEVEAKEWLKQYM